MFDCIFDQRLQQQWRDQRLGAILRNVIMNGQPVGEPHPLDFEVHFLRLDFLGHRDQFFLAALQGKAQEV
jgi:hypothetical protein